MDDVRWLELDGADNVRDVGGLPTADGHTVAPGRLIRSDSLQALTDADVRYLVDDVGVRAVADLRSNIEVSVEGPGPLTREPEVAIEHLSLFAEVGTATDAAAVDDTDDAPVLLPWQKRDDDETGDDSAGGAYLGYLDDRPESIVAALRLIAHTDGATIVHCAAGKDRTGTVIALALAEVGVPAHEIAGDYARSADRVADVFERLATRRAYIADVTEKMAPDELHRHKPRAETMTNLLAAVDEVHGGVSAWLRANGWTDADAAALRRRLLDHSVVSAR